MGHRLADRYAAAIFHRGIATWTPAGELSETVWHQRSRASRCACFGCVAIKAGILHAKHTHEVTLEKWNQVLAVNLTGTFLTCREALPQLVLGGGGAIVNTASSAALGGHPWMAAYAASKGGIISFTKTLAIEYAKQGIRANVVLPGAIITPIHGQFRMPKGADGALIQRIIPVVPYAEPETVADAIAFLASDDARYCNGSELRVDGAMMS